MKNRLLIFILAAVGAASAFGQTVIDDSFGAQGTGGAGFLQVANQSSAPGTPTSSGRFYFNSGNLPAWIDASGNVRLFTGSASALTSGRVPFVTTGGILADASTFTFSAGVLTLGTGYVAAAGSAAAPSFGYTGALTTGTYYDNGSGRLGTSIAGVASVQYGLTGGAPYIQGAATTAGYITFPAAASVNLIAQGTDQNITLTPSGVGGVVIPNGIFLGWNGTSEGITGSSASGTLTVRAGGLTGFTLNSSRDVTFFGHVLADGNNTKDVGSSTNAFRTLYAGTSINMLGDTVLTRSGAAALSVTGSVTSSAGLAGTTLNLGGATVTDFLTATATLDYGSILAAGNEDKTITVTGAAVGDTVAIALPATVLGGAIFNGWVTASDTVTIRCNNAGSIAIDPASATYRATIIKF